VVALIASYQTLKRSFSQQNLTMKTKTIFLICGILSGILLLDSISGYLFENAYKFDWKNNFIYLLYTVLSIGYYFKLKKSENEPE
jgi:hypothetical protein